MLSTGCHPAANVNFHQPGSEQMDGILFMVFWIGGAALHTLYDLKIKPRLKTTENSADHTTF